MINLENYREPMQELIENSLESFAVEKSDVTWCTFALYACPWAGWIETCFDTREYSDRLVFNVPSWIISRFGFTSESESNILNDNCPDFKYPSWRSLDIPDWEVNYRESNPIHIRDLTGKDHFIGSANENINGLVFHFLMPVLLDTLQSMKGTPYFPKSQHWFGVQLLDSEFVKFWRHQDIFDQPGR